MSVSFSQLDSPACHPLDTSLLVFSPHCWLPHQFVGRDLSCALRCASNNTLGRHDMTWIRRRFSCHHSSLLSCSLPLPPLALSIFLLAAFSLICNLSCSCCLTWKSCRWFSIRERKRAAQLWSGYVPLSLVVSSSTAWHFPLSFSAKRIVILRLIEMISFVYLTN